MCAADHMTFLGTQPTLTHVPPSLSRSMQRTFLPWDVAERLAQAMPPEPPPMQIRSKS